jgi:hypothetical protein
MLGFGLCVVGAGLTGYAESLHSTAASTNGWVTKYAGVFGVAPNGNFLTNLLAEINSWIQQNVTAVWTDYLVVGIAMAICGVALVAAGDRKTKGPQSSVVRRPQAPR